MLQAAEAAQRGGEPLADGFLARVRSAIAHGHKPELSKIAGAMARRPLRHPESTPYLIVCASVERALIEGDTQGAIEAALFGASLLDVSATDTRRETIDLARLERSPAPAEVSPEPRP